jgi:hypothetical protein
MLYALFWIAVGVVIGWNWPQPRWARDVQQKLLSIVRGGGRGH